MPPLDTIGRIGEMLQGYAVGVVRRYLNFVL
jgi:hypothetical protein